jgi:pyruvate dehydrogenase E1 component
VLTNLGGWVHQVGLLARTPHADVFRDRKLLSALKWVRAPTGRHIELGVAENNLFLLLGALGLADRLFGMRLIPVGTLYDPFIARGLDSLNYACYQDARFILAATPSGITLAPEGGAHQSVITPLIGLGQPGLTMFEPAYLDELIAILRWSLEQIQQPEEGSVYLRLSTRPVRPLDRRLDAEAPIAGAFWLRPPGEKRRRGGDRVRRGDDRGDRGSGPARRAPCAARPVGRDFGRPPACRLACRSRRFSYRPAPGAIGARRSLSDGDCRPPRHPVVAGCGARPAHRTLGVSGFGQSSDIPDLYRAYELDAQAIETAAERTLARSVA